MWEGMNVIEEPAMVYHGTVKNGIVVFDSGERPEDGARVVIEPVSGAERVATSNLDSLATRLGSLAGIAGPGLPVDLARNHDHYLHGTPKP